VSTVDLVQLDVIDCGIDHELEVSQGDVDITQYAWLGIFYYSYYGADGEDRSVTTVALIQAEFVIAPAADIGPIPKHDFRKNSRILLGQDWGPSNYRVRNYVIHPEYEDTYNTIALIQLSTPVRSETLKPLCPPPLRLRNPEFYVVKFKDGDDYNVLQKQVFPVTHIQSTLCRDFYVRSNLYAKRMRPPHVACAVSLEDSVCVWNAGSALVTRDIWGRWLLLGVGVRGPGCGAPSRYLDMMSYYPWIEDSLNKFKRISISKISKQKYVLRGDTEEPALNTAYQRFGNCDPEEKINLIFREFIYLRTDNNQYQFLTYNLSIYENVEFSCLTLELVNASAVSEIRIKHVCPREVRGPPCYRYKGSVFEISLYIMFSESARFEMYAWGWKKNMTLIDFHEWKLEEGTFYEDFSLQLVEYRGPTHETEFGFEPIDIAMWVPEYDVWSSSEPPDPNVTTTKLIKRGEDEMPEQEVTVRGIEIMVLPTDGLQPDIKLIAKMTGIPNPMPRYQKPTKSRLTTLESS
ncbi:uncharacterized protein LOC116773417, partial [Danaus plexippus]|uniref:uncharacterized protein LOC116773417 n=1 Tax=Danaus plexippus TaxID=13037 RepID=UPI002AB3061E